MEVFFRKNNSKKISQIFYPPNKNDLEYSILLTERLVKFINKFKIEKIYIPLGIGWHIDHILIFNVYSKITNSKIVFYEDHPYVFLNSFLSLRLIQILKSQNQNKLLIYLKLIISFYKSSVFQKSAPKILSIPGILIIGFAFYCIIKKNFQIKNIKKLNLRRIKSDITDFWPEKIKSIQCYKSQTDVFFKNEIDLVQSYHKYSYNPQDRKFYENYWQIHSVPITFYGCESSVKSNRHQKRNHRKKNRLYRR